MGDSLLASVGSGAIVGLLSTVANNIESLSATERAAAQSDKALLLCLAEKILTAFEAGIFRGNH